MERGCKTITTKIKAAVKSDKEFLFTAPVMIPHKPDCDFERGETPFTEAEIRFFKESFDDYQIIDKEHQVFKDIGSAKSIGTPVQSFLLENDTNLELVNGTIEKYPKGTWMLTANVSDPVSQQEILDGKLTGWSPSVNTVEIAQVIKKAMATKSSAGQLIHDIENPATITVSLVGRPCQSGSKQCKCNIGSESMSEETKTISKIREILGVGETAATKSDFDALAKQLKEENEAAMKSLADEMGTIIADSIKEALAPLGAVKAKEDEEENEEEEEDTSASEEEGTTTEENPEEETDANAEEDEEENEEEEKAGASKSKTPPIHDGASKSNEEDLDTYSFLGRNADGTRKK